MPKLVIFDLDQTLIDVFGAHDKAYHQTLQDIFGITACLRKLDHPGRRIPDLIAEYAQKEGVPRQIIAMNIDEAVRAYELHFANALGNVKKHVLPGVFRLLDALKKKRHALAIITGDLKPLVKLMLEKTGLRQYFVQVVTAEDAKNKKEMAESIIKKQGRKDGVVIVGDSVHEAEAAKAVGARSIGVLTGEHPKKRLQDAGADYIFKDLRATRKVVEAIER